MPPVSQFPKQFVIRDPIYGLIELDDTERAVLDSRPLQRLKHIHQLAMTYQVYPGAAHTRFEHSLGVMELAGRAFDAVMHRANRSRLLEDAFPGIFQHRNPDHELEYWRRVVRLAGLCHDVGHLPFSHATEEGLFIAEETHETVGGRMILGDSDLSGVLKSAVPPIKPEHVAKLALGEDDFGSLNMARNFSDWESLLAGIIVDDLLGADRMDYLIRDSHHLGVAYGVFDSARLIQSLRAIPSSDAEDEKSEHATFELGADIGGIHAVEGLILARYFMFVQVYFHHTRMAYDLHLTEFMKRWVETAVGYVDQNNILELTDYRILAAIHEHARQPDSPMHRVAKRIHERRHFKTLRSISDEELISADQETEFKLLGQRFKERFPNRSDWEIKPVKAPKRDILISSRRGGTRRASKLSEIVKSFRVSEGAPTRMRGYLFVDEDAESEALDWLTSMNDDYSE